MLGYSSSFWTTLFLSPLQGLQNQAVLFPVVFRLQKSLLQLKYRLNHHQVSALLQMKYHLYRLPVPAQLSMYMSIKQHKR